MSIKEKSTSIRDVAKVAGVSITTVSRIINKSDYPVSQAARERVLEVVEELGYVPNKAAQNLRSKIVSTVGLIVRDIGDPYFSEIARGVTEKSTKLNHMAMVLDSKRDYSYELDYMDLLIQQRPKGIIFAGGGYTDIEYVTELDKLVRKAERQGIKVIALAPQGIEIPTITVDNELVGKKICELLLTYGHKKIGFIGGDQRVMTNEDRYAGYVKALRAGGINVNHHIVVHGQFSWEVGYERCKELFARGNSMDAILCANDNIAIGVLRYLWENSISVPGDISVVGVGDIALAQYTNPPLTTVRLPFQELGKRAVDIICSDQQISKEQIYLDFEVVIRESMKKDHVMS